MESIDEDLRNALWSLLKLQYWDTVVWNNEILNQRRLLSNIGNERMRMFCQRLWLHFFKKPLDNLPNDFDEVYSRLRNFFFECNWYERDALVWCLRESGELEQLRSRFERLRAMTNTHGADIDEWSRRVGRPVRVPRIAFPWPPAPVWQALAGAPAEAPELVWDDDATASNARRR